MSGPFPGSTDLSSDNHIKRNRLDVYLAEFQALQQELSARFDNQRQSFNYLLVAIVVLATLVSSQNFKLQDGFIKEIRELCFYIPLVIAPLGFIFFDNELMIWGIIRYVCHDLRDRVKELVGDDKVMLMEMSRFRKDGRNSRYTRNIHHFLSLGRWLIFLLPVLASTGYASYLLYMHLCYSSLENRLKGLPFPGLYYFIFIMDWVVTVLLVLAIFKAIHEQKIWKHLMGVTSPPASS